ncbi:hypothetical protein [Moraxella sp.]|uniref:hypothetical protein n=1 Tax=Moraxella sp. TaxID=479 RepID=UPI0026DC137B|nr:hypothetical protein [Moraxella sp.]MDO4894364.1 hypothetical protein [Moraxella sp.]
MMIHRLIDINRQIVTLLAKNNDDKFIIAVINSPKEKIFNTSCRHIAKKKSGQKP